MARAGRITDHEIARWRFRSQRLTGDRAGSAPEAVRTLLAVQAENPSQAGWAVACRTDPATRAGPAEALDAGVLVRTHVLRPTWHFVHADDVGWLIDLTGPRIRRLTGTQLRAAHGLDDAALEALTTRVLDVLSPAGELTRAELADRLHHGGHATRVLPTLLRHLELGGLICSGRAHGGEHRYALMDVRVPSPRRLGRGEALAELALRYFTGHGPATERDLAYWATLTLTDVRAGLAAVRDRLECFEHDGRAYWHAPGDPPTGRGRPVGHLLQLLDECYRGYQDSRWVLDQAGVVPRGRESALGIVTLDAQIVAAMRRTVTDRQVTFALQAHRALRPVDLRAIEDAAARYGEYLDLPAQVVAG